MAKPSGGSMPNWTGVIDANQALALLDTVHHWQATRVNRGTATGYSVTITHAGRRVSAQRRAFVDAVNAAMEKLKGKTSPRLRLVGREA